jgi:hypothetical protein
MVAQNVGGGKNVEVAAVELYKTDDWEDLDAFMQGIWKILQKTVVKVERKH